MTDGARDRCRGVLLGLGAGDRNGGPVRMALRLAESLLARGDFDRADVLRRYVEWWRVDGEDSGPTAARVLALVAGGTEAGAAADQAHRESGGLTAGCNPAHRAPPLAMALAIPDGRLAGYARAEAALTHRHPLAGDVSAAVTGLCRALVRGLAWGAALEAAALERMAETRQALEAAHRSPGGRGGYAPEVLQAAAYFVHHAPGFSEVLAGALDFAGPANYGPVLAGAIAGARWGASAIDPAALDHPLLQAVLSKVVAAADALALGWAPPRRGDS
jgi:ADP-ribosylglycohydrolase